MTSTITFTMKIMDKDTDQASPPLGLAYVWLQRKIKTLGANVSRVFLCSNEQGSGVCLKLCKHLIKKKKNDFFYQKSVDK